MKHLAIILALAAALASCSGGNDKSAAAAKPLTDSSAVIDNIMHRRSIRAYKDTPVSREHLELIAKCGINAPSALNQQPWEVRIVDNPAYISGITEAYVKDHPEKADDAAFKNMFRNAPALIFVAGPADGSGNLDCGLMGENMCLAAEALGLGTCIQAGPIRWMKEAPEAVPYVEKLTIRADYDLLYVIGVGYPDEHPEAKPRDAYKVLFVD